MWRRWVTPQNFLLAFIDEFWKSWKIRILKKWKIAGDIIILHMCTKSNKHMRWGFWDTELDRIFLSCWAIFCPLTSPPFNNLENQNFEKTKKASGDVIILNLCNKKHDHMNYANSDMECDRHKFSSYKQMVLAHAFLLTTFK